jgi:hypothetical protein
VAVLSHSLSDIESLVASGGPIGRREMERVFACVDLISVGVVGEAARRRTSGDRVTFGRVCELAGGQRPDTPGAAGEVRIVAVPPTRAEAIDCVRDARRLAGDRPVTGFSPRVLLDLAGNEAGVTALARDLQAAGLESVAELPLDEFDSTDAAVALVRALEAGGLGCWRATLTRATGPDRLQLIERAALVQEATRALRAFAPLPRQDVREAPSTGYDDVRTVAAARLRCQRVPFIQVDWPLYGPKLAQVALTYGANDLDGIAPADEAGDAGPRRAPREDAIRQIRAAGAVPAERDGRYQVAS